MDLLDGIINPSRYYGDLVASTNDTAATLQKKCGTGIAGYVFDEQSCIEAGIDKIGRLREQREKFAKFGYTPSAKP